MNTGMTIYFFRTGKNIKGKSKTRQEIYDDANNSEVETDPTSIVRRPPLGTLKKPPAKKPQMTIFQKKLLKKLEQSDSGSDDPDRAFLLSLLPDMRKLNDDQKLDLRCYILQFFRDIRQNSISTP